jgi:hypothetical protein
MFHTFLLQAILARHRVSVCHQKVVDAKKRSLNVTDQMSPTGAQEIWVLPLIQSVYIRSDGFGAFFIAALVDS